jgi:hypothetical protein
LSKSSVENLQRLALAKKALRQHELRSAIDPFKPDSRPTPAQQEVLESFRTHRHIYCFGGNRSGKTQLLGKISAAFFNRDMDQVDFDAKWRGIPMLILVVARTSEHYMDIWEKKIRPFLTPGTFKEEKTGGVLQRVRHTSNGSKIVFQSHHNPTEAREKVQQFGAHLVALDEQTTHLPLLEELVRRTTDTKGYFFNAMTPKMPAPAVKKYIDRPTDLKRIFKLKMLDNPAVKGSEKEVLDEIFGLPLDMQRTILEGDWYQDAGKVYQYIPDLHSLEPVGYSVNWRHAEFVDPAASGKVGFGLAAENPTTGRWYVIRAKKINGEAATDLLDLLEKETAGLNIAHRVSDPHETWFIKEANKRRRYYLGVKKDGRKDELVKGVSEALKDGWLKFAPGLTELEDEVTAAEWSPNESGKVLNSTKYHILDALQYFVDTRPKFVVTAGAVDILVELDLANRQRKKREAAKKTAAKRYRLRPALRRLR